MRLHSTTPLAIATAALTLTMLAGCVPAETDPQATTTPTPSSTAEPIATPTPTATADAAVPVTIGCDELITPQALYDYNPNFALQTGFTAAAGSLAAEAVSEQGIACSFINLSSNETFVISVAHLGSGALTDRGNALITSSNPVPTYNVEGYFAVENRVGIAQAISSPYWITASSTIFLEPGDVAPLMAAVLSSLG